MQTTTHHVCTCFSIVSIHRRYGLLPIDFLLVFVRLYRFYSVRMSSSRKKKIARVVGTREPNAIEARSVRFFSRYKKHIKYRIEFETKRVLIFYLLLHL